MNVRRQALYEFGHFRLDPAERVLTREGEVVPLTPKVLDLLILLVENNGHIVDKDELMKALWPDTFVEEGNLTQNVSTLRKALGESVSGYRFIETVPKRGYRFVADLNKASENGNSGAIYPASLPVDQPSSGTLRGKKWLLVACLALVGFAIAAYVVRKPAPKLIKTIGVLPFTPISGDKGDGSLGLGMASILTTRLSNLQSIQVRLIRPSRDYSGKDEEAVALGRQLDVDAIVLGETFLLDDRIRVNVRLMRTADGKNFWGKTFADKFTDMFSVEGQIIEQVAKELAPKLSPDEGSRLSKRSTSNFEAYRLFLKGVSAMLGTKEEKLEAITHFKQAVQEDGEFALAYAALSGAHIQYAMDKYETPREVWPRAEEAARKALELDGTLWDAHIAMGRVQMYKDRDWAGAEASFQQAIKLNSNSSEAHRYRAFLLQTKGRLAEAIDERKQAVLLEPENLRLQAEEAITLRLNGQVDDSIALLRTILDKDKENLFARAQLGQAYVQSGDFKKAIIELKIANIHGTNAAPLAYAYARAGKTREAENILNELKARSANGEYVSAFEFALVYTGLGDKDEAFRCLNLAFDERSPNMSVKVNPPFESLHADPRFAKLLRRAGLDE